MKYMRKNFLKNNKAMSVLYDAVLFVVLVSLSSVVLIPAIQNDSSVETTLDIYRENIAEETLLTMLASRIEKFSYKSSLKTFVQLHKTYSNLIAENLASQETSWFVKDFTKSLEKEIQNFLDDFLGDKYGFSFQALWKPANIPSITINLGSEIPEKNIYIAKTKIMIPYNTVEEFKEAFRHYDGLEATEDDLPSIQQAEIKLVIWELQG